MLFMVLLAHEPLSASLQGSRRINIASQSTNLLPTSLLSVYLPEFINYYGL